MLLKQISELFSRILLKSIAFIVCLSISLTFFNSPSFAVKSAMTGDYAKDTISVVKILQNAVESPKDSPNNRLYFKI